MFNLEELSERILKYMSDYDWYDLCDNYGNIETDNNARKVAIDEIYNTLIKSPNDILNRLKEILEDIDEEDDLYEETNYLISEIELLSSPDSNIDL